jgi:hypothetical protein
MPGLESKTGVNSVSGDGSRIPKLHQAAVTGRGVFGIERPVVWLK